MFFTLILIAGLVLLVADAVYTRTLTGLRRRATVAQWQRPTWDLIRPSSEGWRLIDAQDRVAEPDLDRIFSPRTATQSRRPAPRHLERR
jgi:hypothetical protein